MLFSNAERAASITFFIFAILSAIPLIIVIICYLKLTKADREARKEIRNLKYEAERQMKQQEVLKAKEEHDKQLAEVKVQQLQYEKEQQLKQKEILEHEEELSKLKAQNKQIELSIANHLQSDFSNENTASTNLAHSETLSQEQSISQSELLLLKIDSVSTSGIYFEKIACELLKANGFCNIETTPTSNDYGIDILAEKDGISYAIQCKCYSSAVGNKSVQEAASGKIFYKRMVAVVLTNNCFTKSAIETAQATQVLLWDRTKLTEMINALSDENLRTLTSKTFIQ